MKRVFLFLLLICLSQSYAQSFTEMTPEGFAAVEFKTPAKTIEKLIELSKSWAPLYNKDGFDVSHVTENSLTISALKLTACYYYNIGVRYDYNVRYSLKIVFQKDGKYTLTFKANEFYANEVLTKTTVADFFTPDGKLKNDFKDVKPTLEITVDRIIKSYVNFISG